MQLVKECYHTVRKVDDTISLEKAAIHCDIRPSIAKEWMKDDDLMMWFETEPLSAKISMRVLTLNAIREARDLMKHDSSYVRESMAKFFINHGAGKPIDKKMADYVAEEEDGVEDTIDELTELEKKLNKMEEKKNVK